MMIKMLVHQNGPFVRRELAEKTVRMFGAAIRPGGNESIDQSEQSLSFDFQISLTSHDQPLDCWRISAYPIALRSYSAYPLSRCRNRSTRII
jgi:hypothetical protein